MEIKGLDVSSYQGKIHWPQVAEAGCRYGVLRSITRTGVDFRFEENYRKAREAGLKVGVYAFSYALTEIQSVQEAKRVAALLGGRSLELPVYLDLEWSEQRRLGKERITAIAQAFLEEIQSTGSYKVGIYCNTDWYYHVLDPVSLPYDYWIASYGKNDGKPNKRPLIPNMAAWQYTSQGIVPGISGRVDLDVFYKEYESGDKEEDGDGQEQDPIKKSGWQKEDGRWRFYLGNTGEPVKNDWYQDKDSGKWYWFDGAGYMVHDTWYQYKDHWYYLGSDGAMVTGQQTIDGKWYILDSQGRLVMDPVVLIPDREGALHWPGWQIKG